MPHHPRPAVPAALVLALVAGLVGLVVTAPAAQAADDSAYSDIARITDVDGTTTAQGFAAGDTHLYAIKTNRDDTRSVIHRIDRRTGDTRVMTTGGKNHNPWLGHANDVALAEFKGKQYMFVVTLDKRKNKVQLVQLSYSGTTYTKVRSFFVTYQGKPLGASGVARVSTTQSRIKLFFKSAKQVYRGAVTPSSGSRTIKLSKAFVLSTVGDGAKVEGKTVSDLSSFINQGFHYDPKGDTVHYPLTKGNRSVVLGYRGIDADRSKKARPTASMNVGITSTKYPTLFEVESVGLVDGRLYFNTNRAAPNLGADAVHVLGPWEPAS